MPTPKTSREASSPPCQLSPVFALKIGLTSVPIGRNLMSSLLVAATRGGVVMARPRHVASRHHLLFVAGAADGLGSIVR